MHVSRDAWLYGPTKPWNFDGSQEVGLFRAFQWEKQFSRKFFNDPTSVSQQTVCIRRKMCTDLNTSCHTGKTLAFNKADWQHVWLSSLWYSSLPPINHQSAIDSLLISGWVTSFGCCFTLKWLCTPPHFPLLSWKSSTLTFLTAVVIFSCFLSQK